MKVREVLRVIEADGWRMVTQRGSHRQYKHPAKQGVSQWPGTQVMTSELEPSTAFFDKPDSGRGD